MVNTLEIDERIDKCQKILEIDPNSQIFAALSEAYRKKGELEKAFRICQNGLKIHPSYASAHVVMAKVNLDRGLYDWAEVETQKAIDIGGRTRAIELLLSEIYIYKGEFNRAITLLKKLNQTDPDNSQIKKLLEIARKIPEEQTIITSTTETSNKNDNKEEINPLPSKRPELPKTLGIKEVLEKGIKIPGVDGALFINFEGLLVEKEWTLVLDSTLCGATLGDIGNLMNNELVKSPFGNFITVLIETDEKTFYLNRVNNGIFLFVANESANLGTLRMKIENLLVMYQ